MQEHFYDEPSIFDSFEDLVFKYQTDQIDLYSDDEVEWGDYESQIIVDNSLIGDLESKNIDPDNFRLDRVVADPAIYAEAMQGICPGIRTPISSQQEEYRIKELLGRSKGLKHLQFGDDLTYFKLNSTPASLLFMHEAAEEQDIKIDVPLNYENVIRKWVPQNRGIHSDEWLEKAEEVTLAWVEENNVIAEEDNLYELIKSKNPEIIEERIGVATNLGHVIDFVENLEHDNLTCHNPHVLSYLVENQD